MHTSNASSSRSARRLIAAAVSAMFIGTAQAVMAVADTGEEPSPPSAPSVPSTPSQPATPSKPSKPPRAPSPQLSDEEREARDAAREAARAASREATAAARESSREAARAAREAAREATESMRREPRRPPTEEESLALAALEGLVAQPSERSLPILQRVLKGTQSTLVKERALFVVSQIDKPEAHQILLDYARTPQNPLRGEAIRMIGIGGKAATLSALKEIYDTGDARIKREVLQAWLIAGRKSEVYQVAANAQNDAEAANAVRILSAMGAVDELRKLGDQRKHSRGLLEAYAVAGDLASLRKIADGNGEMHLRAEAVRRIGIIHSEASRVALRELYANAPSREIRDAALQGMLIGNDQQGVLELYRVARTPDEKRALLRTLSVMGGDAALAAIDAALDAKK